MEAEFPIWQNSPTAVEAGEMTKAILKKRDEVQGVEVRDKMVGRGDLEERGKK